MEFKFLKDDMSGEEFLAALPKETKEFLKGLEEQGTPLSEEAAKDLEAFYNLAGNTLIHLGLGELVGLAGAQNKIYHEALFMFGFNTHLDDIESMHPERPKAQSDPLLNSIRLIGVGTPPEAPDWEWIKEFPEPINQLFLSFIDLDTRKQQERMTKMRERGKGFLGNFFELYG